jgi:hypothetical protein
VSWERDPKRPHSFIQKIYHFRFSSFVGCCGRLLACYCVIIINSLTWNSQIVSQIIWCKKSHWEVFQYNFVVQYTRRSIFVKNHARKRNNYFNLNSPWILIEVRKIYSRDYPEGSHQHHVTNFEFLIDSRWTSVNFKITLLLAISYIHAIFLYDELIIPRLFILSKKENN